jgi:hypothetical protein
MSIEELTGQRHEHLSRLNLARIRTDTTKALPRMALQQPSAGVLQHVFSRPRQFRR